MRSYTNTLKILPLEAVTSQLKTKKTSKKAVQIPLGLCYEDILNDYALGFESRQISLMGRKEVFAGKAKFGIFGDGKELPQLAMARVFRKGDFRSGYYRDQTFMMAIGALTSQHFFAQLYAHPNLEAEPSSAGRQMSCHFSTRFLDEKGDWLDLTSLKNSSSDISPTSGQMPRLVGLAYASKLFRKNKNLHSFPKFSNMGNEIAFGTIGNASTSEGPFFEAFNAAGVLQIPMLISVWDDDYGISVPKEYHTTKGSISEALQGFARSGNGSGFEILKVNGWDYPALLEAYEKAEKICRKEHIPVLIHVTELTQPQGHSTSGSHERYKDKTRLDWEKEHDCLAHMKSWILQSGIATEAQLEEIEKKATDSARNARNASWKAFNAEIKSDIDAVSNLLDQAIQDNIQVSEFTSLKSHFLSEQFPIRSDALRTVNQALRILRGQDVGIRNQFLVLKDRMEKENADRFNSHLYSQSEWSAMEIGLNLPQYLDSSPLMDGREILQAFFDKTFEINPLVFAIGEDVGKIGDVNQGFAGLQEKYGEIRITDTGIRECTIVGQGIGAAMRGLRPIVEIQYLDYLLYALQILSDDASTLQYRTKGGQKAPLIVRTRGHRLEGVWHAGSPMGVILNALRGMYVLTPRNMTQAVGFYNTLLKSDEPGLIIECLNGYRLKEKLPENLLDITLPLGVPEILRSGNDITLVTYGSMCRICLDAADQLSGLGIEVEVIDVQSLLPFDVNHSIVESLKKTNRVIFADEDVPGGATSFMMQQVLENQNGYRYLDAKPITITAQAHRPAYASDGDYFSKPTADTLFEAAYSLMNEANPIQFPDLY